MKKYSEILYLCKKFYFMKKPRLTKGVIIEIPLENNFHTYGRMMEFHVAFYDSRTQENLSIEEIVQKPVLFSVTIYDRPIREGWWKIIGKKLPLEANLFLEEKKPAYTEDILADCCFIHYADGTQKKVNREEVQGLESCTVWTHTSIEQRLNDFYAGRFNWQIENIKIGRPVTGPSKFEWFKILSTENFSL